MRVGLVCPYPWDVPGGVREHVADLAEALAERGHAVAVIASAVDDDALPPHVTSVGRPVGVPFNQSVARLAVGPLSNTRVRRWLADGHFDVLHVHEPAAPSVSMLVCFAAEQPVVATFHASNESSWVYRLSWPIISPAFEKITARVAVSDAARRTVVAHVGGDAVVIPNGIHARRFAGARPLEGVVDDGAEVVGFLGRLDEPRKGLPVLVRAFARLAADRPRAHLLVAGPGDAEPALAGLDDEVRRRVVLLGRLSDADKPRFYATVDVYCAPNTGAESFGIVLLEALAAGTPVVATGLDAFRRVLADGRAGLLHPVDDDAALAAAVTRLLDEPDLAARLVAAGEPVVAAHDWGEITTRLLRVYETVLGR